MRSVLLLIAGIAALVYGTWATARLYYTSDDDHIRWKIERLEMRNEALQSEMKAKQLEFDERGRILTRVEEQLVEVRRRNRQLDDLLGGSERRSDRVRKPD
jgi:hypothetical protein